MNKTWIHWTGLAAAVLLTSAAWAQDAILPAGGAEQGFAFKMIADGRAMDVKPIAGAPYSADQTTTTTQTLGDGNRIVQSSTAKVYRDEQGRTRVEHTLGSIGSLGLEHAHTMVMINDPVAGARYHLQPEDHTAQKIPAGQPAMMTKRFEATMGNKSRSFVISDRTKTTHSAEFPMDSVAMDSVGGATSVASAGGAARTEVFTYRVPPPGDVKRSSEDLGAQTIEGLKVTGTRTTVTIPAGAEGNEQPMQIVDEQWYSPELQTNVKTINSDPRMGQTVFVLSNVSRTNPDASLFQIPSDYQMMEGPTMDKMMIHTPGPPPPNQ